MGYDEAYDTALAVIGMAGKFPGAPTLETFWQNLAGGVKSIRFLSDEEMLAAGVDPSELRQPDLVKARGVLDNVDLFDAAFFGYTPREADIMDPQHRLMLESAWIALEDSGYVAETYNGLIGIFAGSATSTYMRHHIYTDPALFAKIGQAQVNIGNDQDSLTTMISYKLNLKGPSLAVQTFCSTSLVAIHQACQSLLNGECDIALAGGVAIDLPQESGYIYEEGGILSPDGECRTFDERGQGSVMGNGVGCVVLKRFHEARADGDHIYALVRGTAINNDGGARVSYTAPGMDGQTSVVSEALANADVDPESIGYIEAHGTATALGDMIELGALLKAFRGKVEQRNFCALGSVKPNVGHLDRAAGVTGFMKTVLALQHHQIPPSLNFERTSPDIDLEQSPFYVNTVLRDWPSQKAPRRAGVSSFGAGGTNVHMILEEAPEREKTSSARPFHLLVLSARTTPALEEATKNLARHLREHSDVDMADLAYTLQVGRSIFPHRRIVVCQSRADALSALESGDPARVITLHDPFRSRKVAFLFPGVGEQYLELARTLYRAEPDFRAAVERCCTFLRTTLQLDLREVFVGNDSAEASQPASPGGQIDFRALARPANRTTTPALTQTAQSQPTLFVFEYALSQLLQQWGIQPVALLGYSLGEYVAACLAGVLSLEDALTLVVQRARLIQSAPQGAMLAINLSEAQVRPYLSDQISLAAINSPITCVLTGPPEAITRLEAQLSEQEVACFRVPTTHAFHSSMLDFLQTAVSKAASQLQHHAPQIPVISNVTGTWLTDEEATDPAYWSRHMCQTVRFAQGVEQLLRDPEWLVLEVGPGQGLTSFIKQHPACGAARIPLVQPLLPAAYERQSPQVFLLKTLGKLWQAGVSINWGGFYAHEQRRRLSLPTYPFERQRYWLAPKKAASLQNSSSIQVMSVDQLERLTDLADWFYLPAWKQGAPCQPFADRKAQTGVRRWLIFADSSGMGEALAEHLRQHGHTVALVRPGDMFARQSDGMYCLHPGRRADYEQLLRELSAVSGGLPTDVVHLWTVTEPGSVADETLLEHGFYSLLALAQSLGELDEQPCTISIVSNETQEVLEEDTLSPAKTTVMGVCRVIPQEHAHLRCRTIDLVLPARTAVSFERLLKQLLGELTSEASEVVVALRGGRRWTESFVPHPQPAGSLLRPEGVYLVTGGLGGIGLAMAEQLVSKYRAKVVLTSRTALPARSEWESILENEGEASPFGRQLQAIHRMETRGGRVLVISADVSQEEQMRAVFQETLETFGVLHGILHTAGVPAVGLMQFKTAEAASRVLAPKVAGTGVLERLVRELALPLDFLVLFSSMSSITGGGPGQIDYSAANAYLGAYARTHRNEHGKTLAIDWGEWQWNGWEAGLAGYDAASQALFRKHRQHFGISFEEGFEVLERLLCQDQPHVVVSTQDFRVFSELSKAFTASTVMQYERDQQSEDSKHERPTISSSYIAPRNELERQIAAVWEDMLGIAPVGIYDNFFELGGNSLTGVALMGRLKRALDYNQLTAAVLYEASSVSALAQYVQKARGGEQEQEEAEIQEEWAERSARRRGGLRQRVSEAEYAR